MKLIFKVITDKLNCAACHTLKMLQMALSIDSMKIIVGKISLLWAEYHVERFGIKLHISFTNEIVQHLQVVEPINLKHDDPIGKRFEAKRFIPICARAYFGIEKVGCYVKEHEDFIIYLKDNVQLNC